MTHSHIRDVWTPNSPVAMARVLAMIMLLDGDVTEGEIQMLNDLDAFRRLQLSQAEFIAVANDVAATVGHRMDEAPFLSLGDVAMVDDVICHVTDPTLRLLTARLAAAMVTADGRVSSTERLIFDHLLCRWGLSHEDVRRAIREDRSTLIS